jgi:hypothetical protein
MIAPFNFGEEELNLDETVAATCIITKGDLPLFIWWSFQDSQYYERNLTSDDGIMISQNSQKISMLNIDAVKARHKGNYTCYAKNRAGIVQHGAYLAINGLIYLLNNFIQNIFHSEFCNYELYLLS